MAVVLVVVLIMISVITDDHVVKHKWSVPIFIRTMELWVYISKNLKLDDELNNGGVEITHQKKLDIIQK